MVTVTAYLHDDFPESNEVLAALKEFEAEMPIQVIVIDVKKDQGMAAVMKDDIPMVQAGPYRVRRPIQKERLKVTLQAAIERDERMSEDDPTYQDRLERGRTISRSDQFSMWLSRHYMVLINLIMLLYVGLPFLAPVLMKANAVVPAKVIYTIYRPFCHQLAFRSFFLYGEQAFYPRELAGYDDMLSYEDLFDYVDSNEDLLDARRFIGDEYVGYKIAICERCLAIYGSLLLFGVLFAVTGKRMKSLPWYLWILLGLIPIGFDGVSQIPSLLGISLPNWLIMRESTPFLRVLTGTLFGVSTAWYLFPLIEKSMSESRVELAKKFAYVEQIESRGG
ncbi:MAG: DUF2085 domain-containing protein [Anaerolineaceae bacterium]|nr:DUF2085 domain-containing protein [Anaerolineaceae bacterium]